MKITEITTLPLRLPYRAPFHWAHGVIEAAEVILVSIHTDAGITGYGESMATGSLEGVNAHLQAAARLCIGANPVASTSLMQKAYRELFAARGNCSNPRFAALVLAGLDMALWDLLGKATGLAVHELLGGAVRDVVHYFGFPQGDSAEEIAADARRWAEQGCNPIYVKVGRNEALDEAIVEQVRAAIGSKRLRLDANESWDVLTAARMTRKLAKFDVEFLEQPTSSASLSALKQVRDMSSIPIAADQLVFSPEEVFEICRLQAADLIVLGVHETGGISPFRKAAAIAEAAGINICVHGLYESGITTCVMNQVAATIPNLDDGNQYMNHFLAEDILASPELALHNGKLDVLQGPGFGFELDWGRVEEAHEAYRHLRGI